MPGWQLATWNPGSDGWPRLVSCSRAKPRPVVGAQCGQGILDEPTWMLFAAVIATGFQLWVCNCPIKRWRETWDSTIDKVLDRRQEIACDIARMYVFRSTQ